MVLLSGKLGFVLAYTGLVQAWSSFTVPHTPGRDDTPALLAALPKFVANSTILFKEGITYNILTPITFPVLNNVEVVVEGNLTYPSDIPTIQAIVGSSTFSGSWFTFTGGNNVTLRGSTNDKWGWVDGHGQAWWDAQQQINRPHGWAFSKINNGVIRDMKIWKPIGWNFATSGSNNLHAFNNKIVAVSDTGSFPFNTRHISPSDTSPYLRNSYCEGGHGLSIGSLGKGGSVADVQNVLFTVGSCQKNTLYGARFKSWTGGNGLARNITWKNIAFDGVPFPIYVTQNYWDQGVGPKPNTTSANNTHIQDFLFQSFVGVVKEFVSETVPAYFVPGATGKEVAIFDLYPDTAVNVVAKDILATTETGSPVAVMCNSTTISTDVGFKCWNGPFIRTRAGI
ncbi:hypothetical protein CVT25_004497 [Psilocybe cyanescens]|uniref:galacturonan 1,4-alpha-galacturonidase n=1 Tax=Psilocybe cyanescens TaxID=93625 RepID=A0A409XRJ0_PSICY|nr:hypothetical protein CVT25_004497 [Psilocybe cyanescens]